MSQTSRVGTFFTILYGTLKLHINLPSGGLALPLTHYVLTGFMHLNAVLNEIYVVLGKVLSMFRNNFNVDSIKPIRAGEKNCVTNFG